MPRDCEVEDAGNLWDTRLGDRLGHNALADVAECLQLGPCTYDGAECKRASRPSRPPASATKELVNVGLDLPAFSLRFEDCAQIIARNERWPGAIHYQRFILGPVVDRAGRDAGNVRRLLYRVTIQRLDPA